VDDAFKKMADQLGAMLDDVMGGKSFLSSRGDSWAPSINFYEMADRYVVCVELAGMEREKIDVYIDDRVLHIRGLRPKPSVPDATSRLSVHLMEIDSGRFHRKVPVAADVDASAVRAVYRKGYVWIDLPRVPKPPGDEQP
jgi:HSP20 family protein